MIGIFPFFYDGKFYALSGNYSKRLILKLMDVEIQGNY